MKKIFNLNMILLAGLLLIGTVAFIDNPNKESRKQKKQKQKEAVQQMLSEQRYTFYAQSAQPMSGPTKQLSYGYDMRVSKDTITAYLPYFGRGYVAPLDLTGGGVEFTSTDFVYTQENAKSGWNVTIDVKDDTEHGYKLLLSVSESGTATLMVNDNTRQSISFYGEIRKDDK